MRTPFQHIYCLLSLLISWNLFSQDDILTQVKVRNGNTPYPVAKTVNNEESCTSKKFVTQMGAVREQTGGTCYAYVAMYLLNYDQEENKDKYSALHLAALMDDHNPAQK
jgi:hypothetical protein